MIINYFGDGCFRLQSGELSLLVDSQNNRLKADVNLKTLTLPSAEVVPEEIAFPGEYELKGIEVRGRLVEAESSAKIIKTVYAVAWEDIRFLFLGHISGPLPAALLEDLGAPDVVFVPTGDDHLLEPEVAMKLVKQLEPKIVIPAYRKNANAFLKAAGVKAETEEKLVFRRKDLGEEGKMRIVVLEARG